MSHPTLAQLITIRDAARTAYVAADIEVTKAIAALPQLPAGVPKLTRTKRREFQLVAKGLTGWLPDAEWQELQRLQRQEADKQAEQRSEGRLLRLWRVNPHE